MKLFLTPKNWDRFQHYKDRGPDQPITWIKLYPALLDDPEFAKLTPSSRWDLIAIWMLCCRDHARVPYDARWLRVKVMSRWCNPDVLVDAGFLIIINELNEPVSREGLALIKITPKITPKENSIENSLENIPAPKSERVEKVHPNFQPFKLHFCERYEVVFKKKYFFQGTKDAAALKRLVGSLEMDDLKNRLEQFFEDKLEWMDGSPDHTLGIFSTQINKYGKRGQYDFRNK